MTQVFQKDGTATSVTVIDVTGNAPLGVRTEESDGYTAVRIGFDDQREQRVNQPDLGQFKAGKSSPKRVIREFRIRDGESLPENLDEVDLSAYLFQEGQWVDVIGTTKGKGFQGVVKRHGFGGLPQSHGSMMHRQPGGIGGGSTPGRVWKNKEMPGRMGGVRRTVQNLQVVQVREEEADSKDEDPKSYLLISGPVPGAKGSYLIIRPAKKKPLPENWPPMKADRPEPEPKEEEPEETKAAAEAEAEDAAEAPAEETPAGEAAPPAGEAAAATPAPEPDSTEAADDSEE